MDSDEIRSRFLKFFEARGHKIIPSSSLVPENDPSVLFTTAGMQQLKPYYTYPQNADKDFGSRNIVTAQKCIRTGDIDEVGDSTHLTFFEMLGNFSFGGYWKREAIQYAYEFITKELKLKIDYVSVFEGDSEILADNESREIWTKINPNLNIKNHNRADNFWGPTGDEGPCGPTTEIYINGVEIWNIVFNEFYKTKEGKYNPLETKGID
ncbi:MAG: Alanine-tRNA ligase, partial [Parcubacteria group bacterium GW2011_GWC1_36_9]